MVGTRDFGFEEGGTTFNFDFERNIARTCWNDSGVRLLAYPECGSASVELGGGIAGFSGQCAEGNAVGAGTGEVDGPCAESCNTL